MSKKKKSNRKIVVWSIIGVVVVAAIILAIVLRPKTSNYTQVKASSGNITTYYNFSGTIAAKNSQILYADKAMQIKEIKVTQGQSVKKDDVLMTTTTGTDITAPFDGTISEIYAAVDAQQMPGTQLCKVVDYSNLELDVQVDEYDLPAISAGKDATVTVNALDKDVSGKVTDVAQEGINQNGVTYFNATISLPSESDLRVGMTAQAKVLNKSVTNVTILPMSAVQFDSSNNSFVYISDGKNPLKKAEVTVGINDGTNVEIQSGLKSGDTVEVPPAAASTTTGFGALGSRGRSTSGTSQGSSSGTGSSGGSAQ